MGLFCYASTMRIEFAYRPASPGATMKDWGVVSSTRTPNFFCCDGMQEAWSEKVICFGSQILTTEKECELAIWYWQCWPEGAALNRYRIDFCPFCGQAIELVRVNP